MFFRVQVFQCPGPASGSRVQGQDPRSRVRVEDPGPGSGSRVRVQVLEVALNLMQLVSQSETDFTLS